MRITAKGVISRSSRRVASLVRSSTQVGLPRSSHPFRSVCEYCRCGVSGHDVSSELLRSALPHPLSSFVGREREVEEIATLARGATRLLTLTGPGGSGKTRLAIQAAARLVPHFSSGLFWVDLTTLRDPALVTETLAQAVRARGDLAEHIGVDEVLLVLDNFEQVVDGASDLVNLLQACPNLHMLVTSRELLRVAGEVEFPVRPLAAEDAADLLRARAQVEEDEAIVELCSRLDNLPLAVELAASRAPVLSPRQILDRLSERLDLFKGGRAANPRHQTLRATLDWSCQLLGPAELSLFGRLAVFEGGCRLKVAEAVASAELDILQSLVDKSLVVHEGERFRMLETIRDYAVERLRATRDEDEVRSRHLSWCLEFLEQSDGELAGRRHEEVSRSVEAEFANVRAAFSYSLSAGDIDSASRIVAHRRFWQAAQGHLAEGVAWAEAALSAPGENEPGLRAKVLAQAGDFCRVMGDLDEARQRLEAAIRSQRGLSNPDPLGESLFVLGRVELSAGNLERAGQVAAESVTIARATGDQVALGERLAQLGEVAYDDGDSERARLLVEEAAVLAQAGGDAHTTADSLRVLGMIARDGGHLAESRSLLRNALGLQRELADWNCVSLSLSVLADLALRDGRHDEASALFRESLELQRSRGQWYRALDAVWGLAAVSAEQGQVQRAVQLLGAEHRFRNEGGTRFRLGPPDRRDTVLETLRRLVDEPSFGDAWQTGLAMGRRDALTYALASDEASPSVQTSPRHPGNTDGASCVFRREGEYWTVVFAADTFRLGDTKGLHHLARLLEYPGREFHVLDLVAAVHGTLPGGPPVSARLDPAITRGRPANTGPLLDEQAKRSYKERLRALDDELEEATAWSDLVRAARLREERDFLIAELASAVGLGGKDRMAGSDAERARVNVTRAIRAALMRIREHSGGLADHLDATVHTGTFCSYAPDPRAPISWQIDT